MVRTVGKETGIVRAPGALQLYLLNIGYKQQRPPLSLGGLEER